MAENNYNKENFTCPSCQKAYDKDFYKPRFIELCYHTVCEGCLYNNYFPSKNPYIICPIDGNRIDLKKGLDEIPVNPRFYQYILKSPKNRTQKNERNYIIKNIIPNNNSEKNEKILNQDTKDKTESLRNINSSLTEKNIKNNPLNNSTYNFDNFSMNNYENKKNSYEINYLENLNNSTKKNTYDLNDIIKDLIKNSICNIHKLDKNLICVNDLRKICSKCPTDMYDHSNHLITAKNELMNELYFLTSQTNNYIDLFENLKINLKEYERDDYIYKIKELKIKSGIKKTFFIGEINLFFEKIKNLFEEKKMILIKEIEEKFLFISDKLEFFEGNVFDIKENIEKWNNE